ncbi:metal-dependent hydrolase [Sphingomicrobium sp. XHP0235]|uniref:metal-dependent hydrolase n=1 Tax=Sphingomicrobium aquimarinum TaxID=3133971 RepID=UPI0031FEF9D9
MDNVTHSLAGALLGQMGLKKLTGRAMPTLIIAANLPDLDAVAVLGGIEHLAVRRGITHGPIAMLVLPLILTGLMLLYNRWRPSKQEVRPSWLLLLAFIGTLSHPALDWLNSYGIRLLAPFSDRWFAGDTLFIIDPWVWGLLVLGFTISQRWEKRGSRRYTIPAGIAFILISAYIAMNGFFTGVAEKQARELVGKQYRLEPQSVVASPVPFEFWNREILWRGGNLYGFGAYEFPDGVLLTGRAIPSDLGNEQLRAARGRDDVDAFLFWSRMPIVIEQDGRTLLADQRYLDPRALGNFSVDLGPAE